MQWLLEKGAEVAAKTAVRGDPTGQGDPEGVGKGLWGPHSRSGAHRFPQALALEEDLYRGAAAVWIWRGKVTLRAPPTRIGGEFPRVW